MQIKIRRARDADIVWLLDQLKAFSVFHGTKLPVFGDVGHAHSFMLFLIAEHLVLIAEDTDVGPVGFIAGSVTTHLYNPAIKVLTESFWWVEEASRGSRAGLMLLNAFTDWGKENCNWTIMTLEHHSPVNEKSLLKRGYKPIERSYLLENA